MSIQNVQNNESNIWKNPAIILILILGIGFVILNILIFGRNDSLTIFINTVLNAILALLVTISGDLADAASLTEPPGTDTLDRVDPWVGFLDDRGSDLDGRLPARSGSTLSGLG